MSQNPIEKLLNPNPSPRPAAPLPAWLSGESGPGITAMDPTALRAAAKRMPEVVEQVHTGGHAFAPDTDRAAAALGSGWATAAALKQLSAQWTAAFKRVADELDYLGDAVDKCARTRQWSEQEIQGRIAQIRLER
jgi:hypothetical protein